MARADVGILGCGRFGSFVAKRLAGDCEVVVWDVRDLRREARGAGARWGTLENVAACRWVVTAVPIGRLRDALVDLAPLLRPGSVVVEVCSVKALPSAWLRELLPRGVAAVPTHPLFGPDSAARSLRGLPLVVCPLDGAGPPSNHRARARRDVALHTAATRRLAAYARSRGLRVVTLDADEHDRAMARTQALTFFLSRVLSRLDLPDPTGAVGTPSYRRLRAALESVAADTDELYHDLVRFNPHARRFLHGLGSAFEAEAEALPAVTDWTAGSTHGNHEREHEPPTLSAELGRGASTA